MRNIVLLLLWDNVWLIGYTSKQLDYKLSSIVDVGSLSSMHFIRKWINKRHVSSIIMCQSLCVYFFSQEQLASMLVGLFLPSQDFLLWSFLHPYQLHFYCEWCLQRPWWPHSYCEAPLHHPSLLLQYFLWDKHLFLIQHGQVFPLSGHFR